MNILSQYVDILRCPDDYGEISHRGNVFQCTTCKRIFPTYSHNVIELMPKKPYPLRPKNKVEQKYWEAYQNLLREQVDFSLRAKGWGYMPILSCGLQSFIKREREKIKEYIGENIDEMVCDVCGGAGSYSLEFAKTAKLVVHCDIDVESIVGTFNEAKNNQLNNILFVRSDYLQLPFATGAFDSVICIDALERGFVHELRLLQEVIRCLKVSGKFAVDFHGKRKIKNHDICEYNEQQVLEFIETNIHRYSIAPLGYVPAPLVFSELVYTPFDRLFKMFFAPQRFLVTGVKTE